MHLQRVVEQLGYGELEAKTYLASLNLGEATVTEIALKARIPRTSCYHALEALRKDGLMRFYVKKRRRYWIAENPSQLSIILRTKEAALKEALPELQGLRHETGVKPTVRFYDGNEGIRVILSDILEEKRHILSLTSLEDMLILLEERFRDFIRERHTRFLRVRFLTNRSPETLALKKRDAEELRTTRFLPEEYRLRNSTFIYGNRVAIMSLNKKRPVGIIIEDEDIAETQTMLFESLWRQSNDI